MHVQWCVSVVICQDVILGATSQRSAVALIPSLYLLKGVATLRGA